MHREMWYINTKKYHSALKKKIPATFYNRNELPGHSAKQNSQSQRENCDSTPMKYLKESESQKQSRKVDAKGWGEWKSVVNGDRVSVLQEEKVLEICCTTV